MKSDVKKQENAICDTEEEMIQVIANKAAKETVNELKRQGMYRDCYFTPYQKTEYLLKNYNNFLDAIKEHDRDIQDVMVNGLKQKSKSITSYPGGTRSNEDEYEKIDAKIDEIKQSSKKTKRFIQIIEKALWNIKEDPYYCIIPSYYFDGKTHEVIADEIGVNNATVSRNRKRLINKLKIMLFSDEVIAEIFC